MTEEFFTHEFDNGLVLLAQRMDQVTSAAMTIALPMGASRDPVAAQGAAAVTAHWLPRGAGDRDSRQLHDALDALGCQHHENARSEHLTLSASLLGRNLPEALPIYADMVRRPRLSEETFASCRDLVAQALSSLEDEPMRMCNVLIREKFYGDPLGRNPLGTEETLAAMEAESLREHVGKVLTPTRALLSVAGSFDWLQLRDNIDQHFGDWSGEAPAEVKIKDPVGGVTHLAKPTAQEQITLAFESVPPNHDSYYAGRIAEMVLSGGMGARLFTEVREKRALVYAVMARYHCLRSSAGIFVYAGTTPQRAQETLDVTVGELRRLAEGIEPEELARSRTQLKSTLVMQGESTAARSEALVSDYHHLGRLRGLEEISAAIDAVTADAVMEYIRAFPARDLTVLTIGPEELDTSVLK